MSARINEVTPITPISLITLALLSAGERALTLDEVMQALEPFVAYVAERDLPVTEKLSSDDRQQVVGALGDLADHGVVSRFEGLTDVVYQISRQQHLAAAYYRNTIIHFFINGAIVELALLKVLETDRAARPDDVIREALRIRDLLKFEFFFAATDEFSDQIRAELAYHDADWKTRIGERKTGVVLEAFHPFRSPAILRPFFDAYAVVGQIVEAHASEPFLDPDVLKGEAFALARQWLLQGRLRSPESISLELFTSALQLADNRGLFDFTADSSAERLSFAKDLRRVARRLETLESLESDYTGESSTDHGLRD